MLFLDSQIKNVFIISMISNESYFHYYMKVTKFLKWEKELNQLSRYIKKSWVIEMFTGFIKWENGSNTS